MQQQATTKLVSAVMSVWESYIRPRHREGVDRGAVFTFGNTCRVEADFTTSLSELAATLNIVMANGVRNEGTRLYDTLEDMVNAFWMAARRDCQWDALVITDGMDNRSRRYPHQNATSPELIGRYIGTRFNHLPSNRILLFGVGSERQLNAQALGTIAHHGNFRAIRIEGFSQLDRYIKEGTYNVTRKTENEYIPIAPGVVGHIQNQRVEVARRPTDYAILLDVSHSMGEPATNGGA
jgi:hypothetical protein